MRGIARVHIVLKTCEDLQMVFTYIYLSDVFARINENLILKNKNEKDVLKMVINFKELKNKED